MKIAFSTSGNDLNAPLDNRFGRAPKFLIYDLDANTFTLIDNQEGLNAARGAGIQSAQTVAQAGVSCLVTGNCGPKAFQVLSAAGIKIYNTAMPTIAAALEKYRSGQLAQATGANVEGHWS